MTKTYKLFIKPALFECSPKHMKNIKFIHIFAFLTTPLLANPSILQINQGLQALLQAYPHTLKREIIGYSEAGVPIGAFFISNKNTSTTPKILFSGVHHGDEPLSALACLGVMQYFLNIPQKLKFFELVFVPIVNPDGYSKGRRYNKNGIDINRDYPVSHHHQIRAKETAAMVNFIEKYNFLASLSVHTGNHAVFWPWGNSPNPTNKAHILKFLGERLAKNLGTQKAMPSFFDYPTQGEIIDYLFSKRQTLAFTVEISNRKDWHPEQGKQQINTLIFATEKLLEDILYLNQPQLVKSDKSIPNTKIFEKSKTTTFKLLKL